MNKAPFFYISYTANNKLFFNFFQKISRRHNNSFFCFNNEKQNMKKISNIKNVDLKYNVESKKVEIYIDHKKFITNGKNDFAINNIDICFLIKCELFRNRKNAHILKMPLTLITSNLIDFLNLKRKGENNNIKNEGDLCESKEKEGKKHDELKTENIFNEQDRFESNFKKGNTTCGNSSSSSNNNNSHNNNNSKRLFINKNFDTERQLMESKIYENFLNDLVFYIADEKNDDIILEKEKCTHEFINLPKSINYVKNYKISKLNEEQKYVYNKYIQIFESIHDIKLKKASYFETPTQQDYVNKKILKIINNMSDSEIFLFFKCTQILNSFIFTYLFFNGHINYLDVYRYCNLEFIYQFYRWGYVYDVNVIKDSGSLNMLSSLCLIYKLLIKQKKS